MSGKIHLDVTKREMPKLDKFDAEFQRTNTPYIEKDLLRASGQNALAFFRDIANTGADVGNIAWGGGEAIAGGILLPLAKAAGHTVGFAWHGIRTIPALIDKLDPVYNQMVKDGKLPYTQTVAAERWSVAKAHLQKIAELSPEAQEHFIKGLERVGKGLAFTAIDLASMPKDAAEAILYFMGGGAIAVGRPVLYGIGKALGWTLENVVGYPIKKVGEGIEWIGQRLSKGADQLYPEVPVLKLQPAGATP